MIKPVLRRLHSPDLLDLQNNVPSDAKNFCILVQAMIGPAGGLGEESFDFIYCTPHELDSILLREDYLFGKHYLFVNEYDYIKLFEAVEFICSSISGSTWREVGQKLGRYGKWEFDDYESQ